MSAADLRYVKGQFGWACLVDVPEDHENFDTTVAAWFMNLPGQGIGWENFMLTVVTLADMPGRRAANKHYPAAEFELLVAALSPDYNPTHDDVRTWMPLIPVNFVGQFHGVTREQAQMIARSHAWACVHGRLMAETQMYVRPADDPDGEGKMMVVAHLATQWKLSLAHCVEHERTGGLHARVN